MKFFIVCMFAVLATSYAEAPLPYAAAGGPGGFTEGFSSDNGHAFSATIRHGFNDDSVSVSVPIPAAPAPVYGAPAPVYGAPNHQNVPHHETVEVIEGRANLPPPRTEILKNVHIHKVERILEPYPVHVDRTIVRTKHIDRPYPQPVEVIKTVPQPYHVDVVKEVIRHVPVPQPIEVIRERIEHVPVDRVVPQVRPNTLNAFFFMDMGC
uniref:Cuticular protein n=1 Tax=Mayetiola destructor TaxID=39758 RepID=D1MLL9_MAYDE|nr:hypothetical protein [Mayetiola destructor]